MPLLAESDYVPPFWLRGGHAQTIFPALFRRVPVITRHRERIETEDGDFLDLDWHRTGSPRLVILSHGLEGDSRNACVQGMATALARSGWDALAWNFRGCSGEENRRLHSYHSGVTGDLAAIVARALAEPGVRSLALVGFSLGGNVTLKYLGERGRDVDPRVSAAVAFSVPCDLEASSRALESRANRVYMDRFLASLRAKVRAKMKRFPDDLPDRGLDAMRTFREFDDAYTAPLHGFRSAEDYWTRASCAPELPRVAVPTLLVQARNDPFLAPECFPAAAACGSRAFFLEVPAEGGHVGFTPRRGREYWSETRAADFLAEYAR